MRVWTSYYSEDVELLYVLTGPEDLSSTLAAKTEAFTLYEISTKGRGVMKAKKLGRGSNPTELEAKCGVMG